MRCRCATSRPPGIQRRLVVGFYSSERGLKMAAKKKPVIIFDTHRGFYFGYLVSKTNQGKTVKLERARHCFYLRTKKEGGHVGNYSAASYGPCSGSKIGPCVTMTINDVSKIVECSDEAVERWEKVNTWG